jgi:hypothetical protein
MNRNHERHCASIAGRERTQGSLEIPSAKRTRELLDVTETQQRYVMGLLAEHCCLLKLDLVNKATCA